MEWTILINAFYAWYYWDKKYLFYKIEPDGSLGEKMVFWSKFSNDIYVWQSLVLVQTWDRYKYQPDLENKVKYTDQGMIRNFILIDKARRDREKNKKIPEKIYKDTLDPLRKAYQDLRPTEQPFFLAEIVRYITK